HGGLGTPPGSPTHIGSNYRVLSAGKEEEAADSLLKLATPSKSPALPSSNLQYESTPGGRPRSNSSGVGGGVELTPVSKMFKTALQSPENGAGHTPLPTFLSNAFSPGNMSFFSPQASLDFAPSSPARAPWQPITPDPHSGIGGKNSKLSKTLFTDGRLNDSVWCLGTPDKACNTPIQSTPGKMPPLPPPTSEGGGNEVGGDGAAGILMGLRSPGFSSPGDNRFMRQLFMDPLESSDTYKTINTQVNGGAKGTEADSAR
ncbi:unnamed protein product, partial [Discosporangium mesarthrocarpum]